jgi:hypothetical protein
MQAKSRYWTPQVLFRLFGLDQVPDVAVPGRHDAVGQLDADFGAGRPFITYVLRNCSGSCPDEASV